jgi:hypothetical protein
VKFKRAKGLGKLIEDEETWLRRYVMRLRTILRFAVDPRVQTELAVSLPKQRIDLNS